MTTKKELIRDWMNKQQSENNKNIDPMHQNKINLLSEIMDNSLSHVLNEMSFSSPEVLENVISAYLDVSEYLRFIGFRFPDLREDLLLNRIYALGLHLENLGSMNVLLNPASSPLVKFGEGLKNVYDPQLTSSRISSLISHLRKSLAEGEISDQVYNECAHCLSALNHGWIRQEIDDWENINERRKFNAVNIEGRDERLEQKKISLEMDVAINQMKLMCEVDEDIRSFLNNDFEPLFDALNNKAALPYIEDLKGRIDESKNPLINKKRLFGMLNQLVLQERISLRGVRPGEKTSPELSVLRDILMGREIFKRDTDIVNLIRNCDQRARKLLEGRPEFYQKTYAESFQETLEALDYLVDHPLSEALSR